MVPDHIAAQIGKSQFTLPVPFRTSDIRVSGDVTDRYGADWKEFAARYRGNEKKFNAGPDLSGWRLRKIKTYIEENLEERISTQTMAGLVNLSPGYFCPAFKNTIGLTPQAYIMQRRLMRARKLLSSDLRMAINEIAFSCGFTDQAHLNNRFKAAFGVSPGMWRKLRGHANDQLQVENHYSMASAS